MLFLNEQPKTVEQRLSQLGSARRPVCSLPKPDGTIALLPKQRLWATQRTDRYYVVRSGNLYAESNQRCLCPATGRHCRPARQSPHSGGLFR